MGDTGDGGDVAVGAAGPATEAAARGGEAQAARPSSSVVNRLSFGRTGASATRGESLLSLAELLGVLPEEPDTTGRQVVEAQQQHEAEGTSPSESDDESDSAVTTSPSEGDDESSDKGSFVTAAAHTAHQLWYFNGAYHGPNSPADQASEASENSDSETSLTDIRLSEPSPPKPPGGAFSVDLSSVR
jgi:hypothetical protein